MRFLAWNMESLAAEMSGGVEKFCIIIHLWDFSFFNQPPLNSTWGGGATENADQRA